MSNTLHCPHCQKPLSLQVTAAPTPAPTQVLVAPPPAPVQSSTGLDAEQLKKEVVKEVMNVIRPLLSKLEEITKGQQTQKGEAGAQTSSVEDLMAKHEERKQMIEQKIANKRRKIQKRLMRYK